MGFIYFWRRALESVVREEERRKILGLEWDSGSNRNVNEMFWFVKDQTYVKKLKITEMLMKCFSL